jgi:hypothetical protein
MTITQPSPNVNMNCCFFLQRYCGGLPERRQEGRRIGYL